MRTTLHLDDDLMREVKARAARAGTTMTAFIEDALRQAVAVGGERRVSVPIPVLRADGFPGLQPGVDLDNSAALLELMEEVDGPKSI